MSQPIISKSGWRPWLLCGLALVFAFMLESCCGCGPLLIRKTETSGRRIEKRMTSVAKDSQTYSPQAGVLNQKENDLKVNRAKLDLPAHLRQESTAKSNGE